MGYGRSGVKNFPMIMPLVQLPNTAPNPLAIIINKPCADERIFGLVDLSTNSEPDMLKKSNAIPYTIHERIIIHSPPSGLLNANSPKRNTHASMLVSITAFIPKRFRKKGMASINTISDTWDIESIIVEYLTTNESG